MPARREMQAAAVIRDPREGPDEHGAAVLRDERGAAPSGADRVLAVLRLLAGRPGGAGLHELARELSSPKSSVHRALAALRRAGLVEQDPSGRYWLGWDFLHMAFSHYEHLDDVARVRPALVALAERFGETAHYATLDLPEVVYRAKFQPPGARFQMSSVVGGRNPAHCTGVGKVLLAYVLSSTSGGVEGFVYEHGPLVRRTAHTLVEVEELRRELAEIRRLGYGLDREESEEGIVCLALPIFLASTSVPAGAISIAAVAQRTSLGELTQAIGDIRQIVRRELGDVLG